MPGSVWRVSVYILSKKRSLVKSVDYRDLTVPGLSLASPCTHETSTMALTMWVQNFYRKSNGSGNDNTKGPPS